MDQALLVALLALGGSLVGTLIGGLLQRRALLDETNRWLASDQLSDKRRSIR